MKKKLFFKTIKLSKNKKEEKIIKITLNSFDFTRILRIEFMWKFF